MREELRERVDRLPTEPGVYLMRDRRGKIVYIGKAINLRARVRSYFSGGDERPFVALLDDLLGEIEIIIVRNEKEALLLESSLIKQHQPRFNVLLRDDKSFICLRLDEREEWPRLEVVRAQTVHGRLGEEVARARGVRIFGPYSSAWSIRETLRLVNRHFRLRTCSDHQFEQCRRDHRPCMQYQIGRCPGPCVGAIDQETYRTNVKDLVLFLEGREATVLDRLRERMEAASEALQFEAAARFRDQLAAVEQSLEKQRTVSPEKIDRDVMGFHREADRLLIYLLYIRGGKLIGGRTFPFKGQEFPTEELLASFAALYYGEGNPIPDELLLPLELDEAGSLEELLNEKRAEVRGRRVAVLTPKRGAKAELVEMARKNAESSFKETKRTGDETHAMLSRLQQALGLVALPRRIECFDISLFQGREAVGSKVALLDGEPDKARYRRYRIKTVSGTDDFAMLYEVLTRRIKQGDLPDLFLIDGGKGQLGSVAAAMRDAGIKLDLASLAKSRALEGAPSEEVEHSAERVFVEGRKDPIVLKQNSPELFMLARARDEAHRFAITYHRALRSRSTIRSAVSDIPGVGETRRKALLRHFGSMTRLRAATEEELAAVDGIGPALAKTIHEALAPPSASENA